MLSKASSPSVPLTQNTCFFLPEVISSQTLGKDTSRLILPRSPLPEGDLCGWDQGLLGLLPGFSLVWGEHLCLPPLMSRGAQVTLALPAKDMVSPSPSPQSSVLGPISVVSWEEEGNVTAF